MWRCSSSSRWRAAPGPAGRAATAPGTSRWIHAQDIARAVAYALSFAPAFINTMADLDRLHLVLEAAEAPAPRPSDTEMEAMLADQAMQPIFEEHATIH